MNGDGLAFLYDTDHGLTSQSGAPISTSVRLPFVCLLYTSDAADERSSVDLGGRRIIKKKKQLTARVATPLIYISIQHLSTIHTKQHL